MDMTHVLGIDLGKRKFTACLVQAHGGKTVAPPKRFGNNAQGVEELMDYLRGACPDFEPGGTIAAMESTASYWVNLCGRLGEEGFTPALLNPVLVRGHANARIRGRKTDDDNALDCAKAVLFDQVFTWHEPDEALYELRQLCRFHEELTTEITALKNRVLSLLSRVFPEFEELFSDTFGKGARAVLQQAASPEEILALDSAKLTRLIKKASKGRLGTDKSRQLKHAAASSFARPFAANVFSLEVRHLADIIAHMDGHLKDIDKEIARRYKDLGLLLHTIPGLGVYNAAVIASEYGDISRFGNIDVGRKMVAFAGIDAVVTASEETEKKRRMSKKGSPYLRTALYRAAQVAVQHDPMFQKVFERHKNKHYKVAISHVMNKLVHVVASMLRTGQPYHPILT
jgi:transposase